MIEQQLLVFVSIPPDLSTNKRVPEQLISRSKADYCNEQAQSTPILSLENEYWKSTVLALFCSWKDRVGWIQKQAAAAQSQRNFRLLTSTWTRYRMCMRPNHLKHSNSGELCVDPDFAVQVFTRVRVIWGAAIRCNGSLCMLGLFCLLSWSIVTKYKKQIVCTQNSNRHPNSRRLLDSHFKRWKSGWEGRKRNLSQCSKQLITVCSRRIQDSILSAWLEYQLKMVHRINVATILSNKSASIKTKTAFVAWKQFLQLLGSVSTLFYCQNRTHFSYWREFMQVVAVIPDSSGLSIVSHDICLHPYASGTLFNVGDKLSLWTRWEAVNYGHGDASLLRDTSDSSQLKTDCYVVHNETANFPSYSDTLNHQSDANCFDSISLTSESSRKLQQPLNPCAVDKGSESLGLCPSQGACPDAVIDDVKRQRAAERRAQFLREQYQLQCQTLAPTNDCTDNTITEKTTTYPVSRIIDTIDSTEKRIDGNDLFPKTEPSTLLENNRLYLINDSQSCMIPDLEVAPFPASLLQTVAYLKLTETSNQKDAFETEHRRVNTALQLRKRHLIFMQNIVLLYWQEHTLVSQQIDKTLRRINGVLKYKVIVAWMQIHAMQILSQIAKLKHLDETKMTVFMQWVHFFRIRRNPLSSSVNLSQLTRGRM